jgi:hypothetical protein
MRHHNQKTQFWVPALVLTASFFLVAAMALTPALAAEKTTKEAEPGLCQGQTTCPPPAAPGKSTCSVVIDCPPIQSSGKTVCKATIDCPPVEPAKPVKGKKK